MYAKFTLPPPLKVLQSRFIKVSNPIPSNQLDIGYLDESPSKSIILIIETEKT